MDSLSTYLSMGGYADFVWPAYGIALFGLVGALVVTWRGLKAREQIFAQLKSERQ